MHFRPGQSENNRLDIHEWIHNMFRIPEQTVSMIQIDGIRKQVFI
jgi:hypothetical protein